MSEKPTREEMIRMVAETRKHVTSAPVTPEEMNEFPVVPEKLRIPTRVGDSETYLTSAADAGDASLLVINYHGGGFIRCRTESDELFCRRMTVELHCRVLDVDYRLAPEHPFPTGLHESYDVAVWAYEHAKELGADPEKIVLMGHSAGGNFVVGISMMLEQSGIFKPLGVVSDYPPMDLATDPGEKVQRGNVIPVERARLYNLYYCDEEHQRDPLVSPLLAPDEMLLHFPRTLFLTAGEDSLCTETEQFALRLAQLGNEVTLKRFQGVGHAFTIYRKPGYQEANELIFRFVRSLLQK